MSRKAKSIKVIAMLACLVLLVSACGTAATTTAAATAPTTTAPTTAATTSATTAATSSTTSATTEPAGAETVRIAALKGPTGIGMVKLMEDAAGQKTKDKYTFSLAAAPDDLVAKLSSGEVDIAALPTNLAATLYQKTNGRIKMLAINTLGVLYILENGDTVKSVADLKGKKIAATGQGATPEYAINVVLKDAGIDPAGAVTYMAEHAELATLAIADKEKLIMLPEPFVTTVLSKAPQFRIAINLTEAFASALSKVDGSEKAELAQGCIAVRAEFAEKNPEAIKNFLSAYEASTKWVNENVTEAGELTVKHNIMADAKLAAKAIPNCNIIYIDGADMKPVLEPLLKILFEAKPQSVGGKLPDDNFYYQVG
ncbi:MAG: ABC transporter substrate-binding protein [Saccharofermentanales bacterium]|jgi:NitT/TauT family transport system substrate-binding protein